MSFNYARAAATAQRLIARFGTTATLHPQVTTGPAHRPTVTEGDPVSITVVDLDREIRDASGTLTGQSIRTLYVSTSAGVTPTKSDKVTIDGVKHEIAEVRTLNPGGTTVMHEVDLAG